MSPVFLREKGYSFKIFSNEEKRIHIHVIKDNKEAKFWIEPKVELAKNYGFSDKELKSLLNTIESHANLFKTKYREHIGKRIND